MSKGEGMPRAQYFVLLACFVFLRVKKIIRVLKIIEELVAM